MANISVSEKSFELIAHAAITCYQNGVRHITNRTDLLDVKSIIDKILEDCKDDGY